METFPPVQERCYSCPTSPPGRRSSAAAPVKPTTFDMSLIRDGDAVNHSRAQASRIRGGYRESDTLTGMIQRVRGQFRRSRPDTESCSQAPLVFPPVVPSRQRPEPPQPATFSSGIRLLPALRRTVGHPAPPDAVAMEGRRDGPGGPERRAGAASATVTAPSHAKSGRLYARPPAAATLFSGEGGSTADGSCAVAATPLYELPSLAEQRAQLLDMEACSRQRVAATEAWDRQVTCEMMMVHYVTFILKPEMEELLAAERTARGAVRFEEERERFELCHNSALAATLREGVRATRMREAKLARMERLNAQLGQLRQQRERVAEAEAGDARALLRQYVTMRHGRAIRAAAGGTDGAGDEPSQETASASPATAASVTLTDTTATFRRAAAAAAAHQGWGDAEGGTVPQASRRGSGLVLHPLFGPPRSVPRRNTLGVANYMTLLEEHAQRRALLAQAEAELRADIVALARAESNAVRGWQHKKLHLERLLYWRSAREQREQEELAALTDVSGGAATEARLARVAFAKSLDSIHVAEHDDRAVLDAEERDAAGTLEATAQHLAVAAAADGFVRAHAAVGESMRRELLGVQADVVAGGDGGWERASRRVLERAYETWVAAEATPRRAVLHRLNEVSRSEAAYTALRVLQRAFRRSSRGEIGWRRTHRRLGEEVRRMRADRARRRGEDLMGQLRNTLEREQAALEAEILAEHAAAQQVLHVEEFNHRLALESQEAWTYRSFARQFVDELVSGILQPRLRRCEQEWERLSLQITVREELRREEAYCWFARVAALVDAKASLLAGESAARRATVQEERAAHTRLVHAEQDGAEDVRLAAEARVAARLQEREAFVSRAEKELGNVAAVFGRAHAELGRQARAELLAEEAADPRWWAALAAEEAAERDRLCEAGAEAIAAAAEAERRAAELVRSFTYQADCLAQEEAAARTSLETAEATEWHETAVVAFYNTPNGERIFTHHAQRQAVRTIAAFYIATRDHEVGRTATLRHLHNAFAVRRELAELAAIRARQRAHVRAAERQLAEQLEEERADAREACQFLMDVTTTRTEPREREELRQTEVFLRQLIFANFFQHDEDDVAADGQLTVAQRIDRELLTRVEAREREAIAETWAEVFQRYFVREKADAVADAQARAIQRVWRQHCRRRECRRRREGGGTAVLAAEEAAARVGVELAELTERATDVALPSLAAAALLEHTRVVLPAALDGVFTRVLSAALQRDERAERLELLWEQRYALCNDVLCGEEARARRQLVAREHASGLEQAHLKSTESVERELLVRERTLFLLRVLAKEESATRTVGIEAAALDELRRLAEQRDTTAPAAALRHPQTRERDEL